MAKDYGAAMADTGDAGLESLSDEVGLGKKDGTNSEKKGKKKEDPPSYPDPVTDPAGWAAYVKEHNVNFPSPAEAEGLMFEAKHGKQLAHIPVDWSPTGDVPERVTSTGVTPVNPTDAAPAKPATTTTPANPNAISSAAQAADQMFTDLGNQFSGETAALAPYMGGAADTAAMNYANSLAQSIGGPGVQAQNPAYAAALAGPEAQVAGAAQAGAGVIGNAIGALGAANELNIQTAPYQGLLAALGSEAQYKAETGTPTFTPANTTMPTWIQDAYQATIGNSAPGTTAVGPATANPNTAGDSSSTDQNATGTQNAGGG